MIMTQTQWRELPIPTTDCNLRKPIVTTACNYYWAKSLCGSTQYTSF